MLSRIVARSDASTMETGSSAMMNFGLIKSARATEVLSAIKDTCFCTHECFMMTNILFNPRMYPQLLRETLKIRTHQT